MRSGSMVDRLYRTFVLSLLLVVGACGGGGGGGNTPAAPVQPVVLTNFTTVTVDDGPDALRAGSNPSRIVDAPYATITVCVPRGTICQTIDHVTVDTGSVGLRVLASVLDPAMLAGLPHEQDSQGNPVGSCYGFVDGYVFGSVRQADFTIGGEKVAGMPLQVIGDIATAAPSRCSAGGGDAISTPKDFGANAIIGIGVSPTDCGRYCTADGGAGPAIYFDCPAAGCGAIIGRAAATSAPFQQLPNPVAAMTIDNNGSILILPSVPASGQRTASGTLYFGIGTQTNNGLGTAVPLLTSNSGDRRGEGLVTITHKGRVFDTSFIDSGSTAYFFPDASIAACTYANASGFYCPTSPLALSPTIQAISGATISAAFTLGNAQDLFASGNAALPGLGADPGVIDETMDIADSFDLGLPGFFGHSVFVAIEGRTAGGVAGPFFAIS